MNSPLLELKQISVSFEGFLALRDLDLVLNKGDLRAAVSYTHLTLPTKRIV